MPCYFIHLVDSTDVLLDPEGVEIPEDQVAAKALACARDCIAHDAKDGKIDLRYRIDVHDESDTVVTACPSRRPWRSSGVHRSRRYEVLTDRGDRIGDDAESVLERQAVDEGARLVLGVDAVAQVDDAVRQVGSQAIPGIHHHIRPERFEIL
jgi:hypothetical protein